MILAVVDQEANGRLLLEERNKLGIPLGSGIESDEAEWSTTEVLPDWPKELHSQGSQVGEVGHGGSDQHPERRCEVRHVVDVVLAGSTAEKPAIDEATRVPRKIRSARECPKTSDKGTRLGCLGVAIKARGSHFVEEAVYETKGIEGGGIGEFNDTAYELYRERRNNS